MRSSGAPSKSRTHPDSPAAGTIGLMPFPRGPGTEVRSTGRRCGPVDGSAWRQTADFEQFEPECLDLGQHAIKLGLVGERTSQHGLVAVRAGLEDREGGAHHLAQAAADTDLVALGLRILACAACLLTAHRRTPRMFRE